MEEEAEAMRFKALALLGLILILLILYLLFLEIPSEKRKKEMEAESKRVLVFKEGEIKGYEIISDLYSIRAERDDNGTWKIIEPIKVDPDSDKINRFISLLENIEVKRIIEEKPSDLKRYGLDKPEMEILLRLKDREEGLMLGDRGPVTNTLYIKKRGNEKILLVDDQLIEDIPDKFSTWRRAKVFPFDPARVDEVKLEYRDRSFLINKDNDKWILKRPIETPADQAELNDLLSLFSSLSARDFIDEGKEDLIKKISPPILKATLNIKGEERTASFYLPPGSEKGIIYAVTITQEPIYKIDGFLLKRFDKDLYKLREKRALDLKEETVARIEIRKNNRDNKIVKKEDSWIIEGKPEQKIESSRITSLLNFLKDIKVERFVDDAPPDLSRYGLNKPRNTINLFDNENKPIGGLLLGKEKGGMLYAKNDKSRSIFMVKKEVLGSIPGMKDLTGNQK